MQPADGSNGQQNLPANPQPPPAENVPSLPQTTNPLPPSLPPQTSGEFTTGTPAITDGIHIFSSSIASQNQEIEAAKSKSGNRMKILKALLIMLILAVVFVATPAAVWAIAYEKIELRSAPEFQQKVSYVVMSLPFTPKTAKFILIKSTLAGQDITSSSFDISAAIDSSQADDLFGLNKFDFSVNGAASYADPKNINTYFNLSITKDFNMDFRKKEDDVYFKINKVPSFLLNLIGIRTETISPLINRWVHYDAKSLDTDARKMLDEKPKADESKEAIESFERVFDKKLLSAITVKEAKEEEVPVYVLTLKFTDDLLDHFFRNVERESSRDVNLQLQNKNTLKPSDNVKNMNLEFSIEKDSYNFRKVSTYFDFVADNKLVDLQTNSNVLGITSPSFFSPGDKVSVAIIATFKDYGKMVIVETPEEAMGFEEFGNKLSEILYEYYGAMYTQTQAANFDSKRMVDVNTLRTSLIIYHVNCQNFPSSLEELTREDCNYHVFIKELPKDPDGSEYYYDVTADRQRFDLCAKLDDPPPTASTCPDPRFNFHVTSF
jgi:hypothetical protein